ELASALAANSAHSCLLSSLHSIIHQTRRLKQNDCEGFTAAFPRPTATGTSLNRVSIARSLLQLAASTRQILNRAEAHRTDGNFSRIEPATGRVRRNFFPIVPALYPSCRGLRRLTPC